MEKELEAAKDRVCMLGERTVRLLIEDPAKGIALLSELLIASDEVDRIVHGVRVAA